MATSDRVSTILLLPFDSFPIEENWEWAQDILARCRPELFHENQEERCFDKNWSDLWVNRTGS